jgi:hypothetical protein
VDGNLSMEIAAWLQGVGTVAAVIVALFLEVFLVWWRRPRFTLEVSLDPQQKDLVTATRIERDHYVCWLRGRIFVADGKKPALNTEVVVQDWQCPTDQDVPFAHGNSLRWANSKDELVRIAPGTWRRVDLLAWMASISEAGTPTLWIALQHARDYPPRPWFHLTAAGDYEVDLVVIADNSAASRWRLSFTYRPAVVESIDDLLAAVGNIRLVRS